MWKAPLIFLATLLLGFAVAWTRREDSVDPGDATQDQTRSNIRRAERWQADDFTKWFWQPPGVPGERLVNPLEVDLKEWSDEELHAALDQGLSDPGCVLKSGTVNELMGLLFSEWTKRDLDAALAWFESIPSESRKSGLSGYLGLHWPKDRAAEGLDYVIKHRDLFRTEQMVCYGAIVQTAIEAAAPRGPGAVEEVLRQLRENQLDPRYASGWRFPPGFDFAALAASPEALRLLEKSGAFYTGAWLDQDRDAAFKWLSEGDNAKQGFDFASSLFLYVSPVDAADHEASAERSKWLAGRLAGLDAQPRRQIALSGVSCMAGAPVLLAGFADALVDPDDRQAVALKAVNQLMRESLEPALKFLEAFGVLEERLDLLETFEVDHYRTWFPAGQETWLRERLAAWNAPPERIEAIIRHRKEVPK